MQILCPVTNQPTHIEQLHGITVNVSDGHGIWLDHGELYAITEDARHEEHGFWEDLFRRRLHPPTDHARELLCPVCGARMELSEYEGVTVDWCRNHGVWLDSGELDAILNNLRLNPAYVRGVALRLMDLRY